MSTIGPASGSEVDEVAPGSPLRQGDVIVSRDRHGDPFERSGVVVTADCHLAHRKHRGHLNFVPLVPSTTYLALTAIDDQLQERRKLAEQEIHGVITKAHSNMLGHASKLTVQRASEWARNTSWEELRSALLLPDSSPHRARLAILADLLNELDLLAPAQYEDARDLLRQFCDAGVGKNYANMTTSLSNRLTQLPDDAFFLNGGGELDEPSGYVCYLRLLQRVNDSEISVTNNPLLDSGERPYRRVGRLCSPFVYALTQSLGYMFSTIGLPTTYEGRRGEAVGALRASLEGSA